MQAVVRPGPHRAGGYPHLLGDLFDLTALVVEPDYHGSVRRGERLERLLDRQRQQRAVQLVGRGQLYQLRRSDFAGPRTALAPPVDDQPSRDGVEQRTQVTDEVYAGRVPPDPQHRLLDDLLGPLAVAERLPENEIEQCGTVLLVNFSEQRVIDVVPFPAGSGTSPRTS